MNKFATIKYVGIFSSKHNRVLLIDRKSGETFGSYLINQHRATYNVIHSFNSRKFNLI